MNKKIIIINIIIILIYSIVAYSFSKYSFNESFVAFRIENTVASNNISASNNDVPQVDNSKNDIKTDSNKVGWVDVVEIEH